MSHDRSQAAHEATNARRSLLPRERSRPRRARRVAFVPRRRRELAARIACGPGPASVPCAGQRRQDRLGYRRKGTARHDRQLPQRAPHARGAGAAFSAITARGPDAVAVERMTSDLETLMANLSDAGRTRLRSAFAADPELADGVSTMLADLPPATQERLMQRLAAHLEKTPLGGGALIPALTDVIVEAMQRSETEDD